MPTVEEVYEAAARLAEPEKEQEELLWALCAAAVARVRDSLHADAEKCRESLLCGAAFLAAADFSAAAGAGAVGEFTAGPITVRHGEAQASALRRQAETLLAPWCGTGFRFVGVPG